jgi:DNA polymerase III epsilon subunit family exonuclease
MIYFIALDFETTGLSPENGDAIVEIGAVKFDIDGNILGTFSELANPGRPIPYRAFQKHRITDKEVAHCDSAVIVWNRFYAWAGDFAALVAHNSSFERRFIDAIYRGHVPQFQYICTLQLARKIYRGTENHKLVTVCDHIGYQIHNAHRALPDARATAYLLTDMIRRDSGIISRFTVTATQTHKVAPVQPKTEKPVANTGRKVLDPAPLPADFPAQWRAITQLLSLKNPPDLAALQETMPEVYDLVVKRWATWNQEQKRACATRITETFGELAQRNAHNNTVPPSDTIGLKSEVTSENRSARQPKSNSSQNSAAELPHRAVASISGHRTEAKTDALTAVEERALIAAEGRRQRLAEEKNASSESRANLRKLPQRSNAGRRTRKHKKNYIAKAPVKSQKFPQISTRLVTLPYHQPPPRL